MRSTRQRVLVINSGSVFDNSMLQLLDQASDLEVAEVAGGDDVGLIAAVAQFQPDTIVVNDSEQVEARHVWQVLKDSQPAHRLRVLVIRMSDNTIEQYDIRQVIASESADLVTLIRST
jgi:hypothetical protein